eukprot:2856629-Rhodomonas_salina.1
MKAWYWRLAYGGTDLPPKHMRPPVTTNEIEAEEEEEEWKPPGPAAAQVRNQRHMASLEVHR